MRRILASAAAIGLMAGTAGTAFAKDHLAPAGDHVFGQDRADASYEVGGEIAAPDAKDGGLDLDAFKAAKAEVVRPAETGGKTPE